MSNEKYNERLQLFRDAMLWNKPKRVLFDPFIMTGWMALDSGYETAEVAKDYDKTLEAYENLNKKYDFDIANGAFRFYFNHMDALGGTTNGYGVNGEDGGDGSNTNVSYEDVLTIDDYDALKEDEMKVIWEKVIFNMYPNAKNFTPQQFAEAVKEEVRFIEASRKADEINEKYGVLYPKAPIFYADCYVGMLFNQYRGIKGLSMDLRRHKEKVYELCEYKDEESYQQKKALLDTIEPGMGIGTECYYDVFLSSLAHTILNPKQVEKLIISPWRKQIDLCVEKKKTLRGTVEGDWAFRAGIGEFLNEYPKGTMIVEVETDDPFEIRKKLPNIGIFGGLKTDVMGNGTPQQCIEMAKKAIDELGTDGGLVLGPNKMTAYKYDMTSENLKAVSDFVKEYEVN